MRKFFGGRCNSDKCHCPDCERERTQNERIDRVETRVSTLEHAAKYPIASTAERDAFNAGVAHERKRWVRMSNPEARSKWLRERFGTRIEFTDEKQIGEIREAKTIAMTLHNAEPPPPGTVIKGCSMKNYERFASGGYVSPRKWKTFGPSDKPLWACPADAGEWFKLETKMTPFMLQVMLHAYTNVDAFHNWRAPAYGEAVRRLKSLGLVEATTHDEAASETGWWIKATEKGKVFIEQGVLKTPMPVKPEPEWRMPS